MKKIIYFFAVMFVIMMSACSLEDGSGIDIPCALCGRTINYTGDELNVCDECFVRIEQDKNVIYVDGSLD